MYDMDESLYAYLYVVYFDEYVVNCALISVFAVNGLTMTNKRENLLMFVLST